MFNAGQNRLTENGMQKMLLSIRKNSALTIFEPALGEGGGYLHLIGSITKKNFFYVCLPLVTPW